VADCHFEKIEKEKKKKNETQPSLATHGIMA
jgi:hypothetical protein